MDGSDFGVDLDTILQAVDSADVLIVRFPYIEQRLLVDVRADAADPPVICLVSQASAIEERFRSVKQARPKLPVPERIVSFQWPRHADALQAAGVWTRIVERLRATGHRGVDARCQQAWQALQTEERREAVAAIRGGDRYDTLWERQDAE